MYFLGSSIAYVLFLQISGIYAWFPSSYPEYCTKDLTQREIPPLTNEQLTRVNKLEQVQIVVRHGARTPYEKYQCWADYSVTWNDCNVTELMLESPNMYSQSRPASWLFRKLYDGSPNYLGGNCYTGQLLSEGYEQENQVGLYLNQAYLNNSNANLNLFDTDVWMDIDTNDMIYLRSDDEQRTLMSGQILLHGMFNITQEIIVPWHTGDYGLDQIYPNSDVCPALDTLEDKVYQTPEWISENTSQALTQLNADLDNIMGAGQWSWDYILDCLMTTVCTNREIPDGSASTTLMNEEIFNATIFQSEFTMAYLNLYNNSRWAKLAMGNTVWHIRSNIENILYNTSSSTNSTDPLKLALFAGHDTTVMPFLAAILGSNWDGVWPGYAALVTLELYSSKQNTSEYLFRMVYNAKPQLVPGCNDTLCDINILLDRMAFGQQYMPCSVIDSDVETSSNCDDNNGPMTRTDWAIMTLISGLLGLLIGASMVLFVQKRYLIQSNNNSNNNNNENTNMNNSEQHTLSPIL